jgi:hypothetical protein
MKLYFYIFTCAYWVSINELKEKSSPQEYAFLFISILDILLFVVITGLINLKVGYNFLNAGIVILSCSIILWINYLIFLRDKKYLVIIEKFKEISDSESKNKRLIALISTYLIVGLLAIFVAILNSAYFGSGVNN